MRLNLPVATLVLTACVGMDIWTFHRGEYVGPSSFVIDVIIATLCGWKDDVE